VKFSVFHHVSLYSLVAVMTFACSSDELEPLEFNGVGGMGATGAIPTGGIGAQPISYCDPMPIMQTSCNGIICHGAPGAPAQYNTDFFNPPPGQTVGQMLMAKPANYELVANPASCPSATPEMLINPNVPSESLILKKLAGTQACGLQMPSDKALTQEQINCFVDWVYGVTGSTGSGGAGTGGVPATGGAATGGVGAGGASTGGAVGSVPPTFDTVKFILTQNVVSCVGSDCHGGYPERLNLLVDDDLLGRLTATFSDVCGMPVVTPGAPQNSALVQVLREGCGNVTPDCMIGSECIPRMPLDCAPGFDCIPDDYIAAVEQWIANGAPP
jgi:hypothetical protein